MKTRRKDKPILETEAWRDGAERIDPRHDRRTLTLLVEPEDLVLDIEMKKMHRVRTQ